MTTSMDRRSFIGGAGLLAATGALGALVGCAPQNASTAKSAEAEAAKPVDVKETMDCDIVVVGAGAAGLASAVQAGELGAKVICVESQSVAGGNANGVEGCFGLGSRMQKATGVEIDPGYIIRKEMTASQYRCSGLGYVDMIHHSGENIDWLLDQGVNFGQVDVDKGDIMAFHRFAHHTGGEDYVPAMVKKAEGYGAQFLYNTEGESVIKGDDGSIKGIYATNDKGDTVQINASAVIIATGGYGDNKEYLADLGLDPDNILIIGVPGHDGQGHKMAVEAGAKSNRGNSSLLAPFYVDGLPGYYEDGRFCFVVGLLSPFAVWVNENGERFVNEDFTQENIMLSVLPSMNNNKDTYILMDAAMAARYINGDAECERQFNMGVENGEIAKAASIEELAKKLDMGKLNETVTRYNQLMEHGSDSDFGKQPEFFMPVAEGPFYAVHVKTAIFTIIGSVCTDRTFRALDTAGEPMDGLYVVGVEGAMLWNNLYTINVSGGCNANNINSARTAVKHALGK